ncbi:MAG: hypothetical protein LBR77_01765 [Lachnospiraceae bacterium]|nr:hypothetical protein [Lachnospiraceae bacterium]
MKIPKPQFFVLYNGKEECDDIQTMKLSDAFESIAPGEVFGAEISLELTLTVLNINKGHNTELIGKSDILSGYVEFSDRVTCYQEEGSELPEAITRAVRECIDEGILKDYLLKHGSEVHNMLIQEWNTETFAEVRAKEAAHQNSLENARRMLAHNLSPTLVAECTGLTEAEVSGLQQQMDAHKSIKAM